MKRLERAVKAAARLEKRGDRAGAVAAYQAIVHKHDHFDALAALGALLGEAGDVDAAVECLERAHALRPRAMNVVNNLAHAYREVGRLADSARLFQEMVRVAPELPIGHYGLGTVARTAGRLDAAHTAFTRAASLSADLAIARLALAEVEELQGNPTAAIQILMGLLADFGQEVPGLHRRLGLLHTFHGKPAIARAMLVMAHEEDPSDAVSAHFLAVTADSDVEPEDAYVRQLFDAYADGYDAHLTDVLETRIPALVSAAVGPAGRVLDVGCGTGLAVAALESVTDAVGVDLSPRMAKRARHSGRYSAVHVANILDFLADDTTVYDVVVAADVLAYMGPLEALFAAVRKRSDRFVFTTEDADAGWVAGASGRFSHGADYVRAAASGWEVVQAESADLRRQGEQWVRGTVWTLRADRRAGDTPPEG